MTVLLDAAVVIIFVITCITGYVMGFFKYAALMLKSVAALIVAVCAALMLAAPAYNAFARDKAVSRIESKIEKFDIVGIMESDLRKKGLPLKVTNDDLREVILKDGDVVVNMRTMLGSKGIDSAVVGKVEKDFKEYLDGELFGKILKLTSDSRSGRDSFMNIGLENERKALVKFVKMLVPRDKHAAAVEIEKEYVSPFGTMIAGALIFIVTAIAASVVFSVIVKVMGFLSRIKVVSAANSFGGLALGIVKGLAYAVLAAYVVSLIVESSKNQLGKINTDIIDNTYLFKYFFRLFYR